MTYTSGSPIPPDSPQARLANGNWRRLNSWWIFAPIIGCGFFGFIGFLVAAIRTGQRHYWIATAAYAFAGTLALTLILVAGEEGSPSYVLGDIAVVPFLIAAFGPIIHAAIKNRDYLTTIAHKGQWHVLPQTPTAPAAGTSSFLGVSNSDYFASNNPAGPGGQHDPPTKPPAPVQPPTYASQAPGSSPQHEPPSTPAAAMSAGSLDINRATADDLVNGLSVEPALAAHVVAARDARGGFRSIDDLAEAASLQPHQLVRFRGKVAFGPTSGPPSPPSGPTGRILDY